MFHRILLAWDGSSVSRRASAIAIDLSRCYESELVAVSVADPPAHAEMQADRAESADAARRHLQRTFADVRDRADRAGVAVEHLIVAGHRHAGRAGRMLLRGGPEKLVADARIPVLVVGEREA